MKNSVELRQERAELIKEANGLLETCKSELRDLNETEQTNYDEKMNAIDKLAKDIEMVERQEKLNAEIAASAGSFASTETPTEVREYSFFKAVQGQMNGKLDGVEREMHEEAVNEARSAGLSVNGLGIPAIMLEQRADVTQTGSDIAPKNVLGYADALREASVFNQVGANMLTGLAANTTIPVTGASTVAWETEVAAANDGGAQFTKVDLTPNRLSAYVNVSKQLLMQNGMGAEQAIIRDLGRAAAGKIDAAMFAASGTDGGGAIAAVSGVNTFTEAATYAADSSIMSDFVEAEAVLAEAGGLEGNLAYVAHPNLLKDLKRSAQVASVNPGMQGNLINGYPTYFTAGSGSSAGVSGDFLFGDFSKLYIGMFGGLDILVDPYTVAANGQVKLVLNQYIDWGVTHGAGFVKATSLIA